MRASISILIGIFIVFFCYQIIKRELDGAIIKANSKYGHISDENTKEVITNLEGIENTVNELNRSFYEMVSELEGKFSIHDKEIELLTERIEENSKKFNTNISKISTEINEGKKNIKKISQSQNSIDRISKKSIEDVKKVSDVNSKPEDSLKIENNDKLIDSELMEINEKNNITMNSQINKTSDKRVFIESLNDLEKEKLRETIIDLRHKGFSINQIAKKLNVGIGELQLVLNLHRL